jgi:hypothetical protein
MERNGRPRRRPDAPSAPPTTITELARRYHSCAVALSRSLGIPMSESFVLQFHNAISSIFIAADRAGVRLPTGVTLPPLADAPVASGNGQAPTRVPPGMAADAEGAGSASSPVNPGTEEFLQNARNNQNGDAPPPTVVPTDAGLPCGGQAISTLKPAQLAMLISKAARLLHDEGERWVALLHALERERNARLARGKRSTVALVPADVP